MKKIGFPRVVVAVIVVCLISLPAWAAKPLVLFDAGHAQTAGNADWVINGGFSDFADTFKAQGCDVQPIKSITSDGLKGCAVLVLPEPNSSYSAAEEQAIVDFVNNGGGLYAIGDHNGSDRNGDGVDSVVALNHFLPKLGLQLNLLFFTEAPVSGTIKDTPITKGVKKVGVWGGTTVKCLASSAIAHITVSSKNGGEAFLATNIVGKGGKVVAMGDSSPYDDGSGDPHDKLYNGFSNPLYNNDILAANSVRWLLEKSTETPRARYDRMAADLSNAQQNLVKNPSDAMVKFAENCEKTLKSTLQENPKLKASFLAEKANKAEFQNLSKELKLENSFKAVHQN